MMPRSAPATRHREHGVALITTVIVVAVLAVVAVAMMQSTTVDRLSSRSVANYTRAKLAAEAGAAVSRSMVVDLIRRYPDSVTVWQNIGGGAVNGTNNEATVLYVRAQTADTNLGASPALFGPAVTYLAQPLVSRVGTDPQSVSTNLLALASAVSSVPLAAGTSVNINLTNDSRPEPFVGNRSATNAGAPVTAAQWIYMTKDGAPVSAANPYVARYAFWIEDESFKINVNVATNGARGASSLGTNPAEVRLDGSLQSSANTAIRNIDASAAVTTRASLGGVLPTAATAALAGNLSNSSAAPEFRFLTTAYSAGLDLSRAGFRRFPLVQATFPAGDSDSFKRFVAAITNANACPDFGQRFYKTNADASGTAFSSQLNANHVTAAHAELYLLRLAASVKDMLDSDSTPTILTGADVASVGIFDNLSYVDPANAFAIEVEGGGTLGAPVIGNARLAAVGKENLPRLQEYAIHGRVIKMDPPGYNTNSASSGANFEITIDHYLEFWNMGTNDIDLSGYWIKIYDMPEFDLGGGSSTPSLTDPARSVTLQIPSGSIPAGSVRVVTTAPSDQVNTLLAPSGVISATITAGAREFSGTTMKYYTATRATNSAGTKFDRAYKLETKYRTGSVGSSVADFGTTMVMGNATNGYLDSFVGLPISRDNSSAAFDLDARHPDRITQSNSYYVRAGSLMGNNSATWNNVASTASGFGDPLAAVGDPRTLNEPLEMLIYRDSSQTPSRVEQSRFLDASLSDPAALPAANVTLGSANANFVSADKWPDCASLSSGAQSAPMPVLNSAFRTIGDLGFVFDPVRVRGNSTNIDRVRSGGRTLRIGQSELWNSTNNRSGLWDGSQTNASRNRVAWRLADIFTTNTNRTNVSIAGLINPNGALRDGGAAMRAALFGMTMLGPSEGSPSPVAGRAINLTNIVSAASTNSPGLIARLTNNSGWVAGAVNPFWERGEISELGGSYAFSNFVANLNAQSVFDRSREEIVRRTIDMITTRGSVFSVYVVGQSLQVAQNVTNVLSTARIKQTFEMIPSLPAGATNDLFDPSSGVSSRFAQVTNYTTRVLQTSYD